MDIETCSMCNTEKHINNFYKIYSECKGCNGARGLERYFDKRDKISKQQEKYYEKNRDKILLQKQNKRSIQIRDLVICYVELEDRLNAMKDTIENIS